MSEQTEIKLKQDIVDLSKLIAGEIKINKDGIVEVPEDLFEKTLPENISLNQVRDVQRHCGNVLAASLHALSEPAIDAFKKDKKLESVSMSYKVGDDVQSHVIERSRMTGAPGGEKTARFGYSVSKHDVRASGSNRGELKKVRQLISNMASEAALG